MRNPVQSDADWLVDQYASATVSLELVTPSQWAEKCRYLPPSTTALPGPYRFEVAPYLRVIVDCLSVDSPVREVAFMKGVQICATVGVLENAIGYLIDHVRVAPAMLVTADDDLAKLRMESYVTPMIQESKLSHLIKSSDLHNARKTGKTDRKVEWIGGGFLIPIGAQNPNKLRSLSIQFLLRDEIDGWKDVIGKDGDPIRLSTDRTAAYESSRKIVDVSTPLIKGTSKIAKRFALGDQRHYFVCCLKCGFPQVLRWRSTDTNGVVSGIVWETDNGRLVPDSVRYLCQSCLHPHTNDDKMRLLSPEHGAEWRPTAEPSSAHFRSYHLSALYSPVGMQTWGACVQKWLEAWDPEANRPRDMGALQVFYNNVLGEPFELRGDKLKFEKVSSHRRSEYRLGEIPNTFVLAHCGSPVLLLVCTVDVHKDNLAVAVFGWARDRRAFLIDYYRFEGNTEDLEDEATWGKLDSLIIDREYTADDGRRYRIMLTLVDSGYQADVVYRFCDGFGGGVFPVKGREGSTKNATFKEFSEFTSPLGTKAFMITVDYYKERWSSALGRSWNGHDHQPETHFNAPVDTTDKQLKELTVESKVQKTNPLTGAVIGVEWRRPSGAANELWDLLVYANAALELLALDVCKSLGLDGVDWSTFYEQCAPANGTPMFYREPIKA